MIILLNGASSVGKSTIAREMMHQSDRPFLYFSVDHIVNFWLDEKFVAFENEPKDWFYLERNLDEKGNLETRLIDGPNAIQLHWDLIESLSGLIEKGYDFIIDEILWDQKIFERYIPVLSHANRVYMVKVICDLMECERREKKRKDRFKGLARGIYHDAYQSFLNYDLEIDTTSVNYKQSAKDILDYIASHERTIGFKRSIENLRRK